VLSVSTDAITRDRQQGASNDRTSGAAQSSSEPKGQARRWRDTSRSRCDSDEAGRVEAAIAADLSLLDAEAVGGAIFRARYGDERWASRQSCRNAFVEFFGIQAPSTMLSAPA
jgi:hypothetical protein